MVRKSESRNISIYVLLIFLVLLFSIILFDARFTAKVVANSNFDESQEDREKSWEGAKKYCDKNRRYGSYICGDCIINNKEECEPPGYWVLGGGGLSECSPSCKWVTGNCGNGRMDDGEECDDGNFVDFDECRNDCTDPCVDYCKLEKSVKDLANEMAPKLNTLIDNMDAAGLLRGNSIYKKGVALYLAEAYGDHLAYDTITQSIKKDIESRINKLSGTKRQKLNNEFKNLNPKAILLGEKAFDLIHLLDPDKDGVQNFDCKC